MPRAPWAVASWLVLGIAALCLVGWLAIWWLGLGFYWESVASSGFDTKLTRIPVEGGYLAASLIEPARHRPVDPAVSAVVLVHGASPEGRSLLLYRILARRLAARGAVVLSYDGRGYGNSPDPRRLSGRYRLPWISDARASAEFLAKQPGVDARNVRVFGHAFGGSVALGLSHEPGVECLLSRIIIVNPDRGLPDTAAEDTGLDPDARRMFESMEVETVLDEASTLDMVLVHTSEEERRHPLRPLIDESNATADFVVLPRTDHYLGTGHRVNQADLPLKVYDARALEELVDTILVPFAEASKDCGTAPVTVEPADVAVYPARSARQTRIRAQPGSRYLVAGNGERQVLIGDSITQAWMELGTDFEQRKYLDELAQRGLNVTLLWTFIGSTPVRRLNDERIGYNAPALWPWCGPEEGSGFDLTCFNPEYFERLRRFVADADERGIVVVLTVHDGWTKDRFDVHPFSAKLGNGPLTARSQYVELGTYAAELPQSLDPRWDRRYRNQYFQERFCARLIEELEPYGNVIYEMFNEGEWYDHRRRRQHEQHFLRFFRARTDAPLASNADHISGYDPRRDPLVDVISLHWPQWSVEVEARRVFDHYAGATSGSDVKPVLFSETVPEFVGGPAEVEALTRVLWGTMLGGASITIQDDISFRFAARSPTAKHEAMGKELLDRLGFAAKFARDVRLAKMMPRSELCSSGVCAATTGVRYVAYAAERGKMWVDLTEADGRSVEMRWYDPRTGTFLASESRIADGRIVAQAPFADALLEIAVVGAEE